MVAAAGNFSAYLSASNKNDFKYNFNYMPIATALIYGVCFGTPILLAIIMKCFGSDITLF